MNIFNDLKLLENMVETNIISINEDSLKEFHYICAYRHTTDFWGGFRKEKIDRYYAKFGLGFNIIIYDSLESPIFYSIPYRDIRPYLNESEGFLPHQGKIGRWQFSIKDDMLKIHGTQYQIIVEQYKNNALNIPQLQFLSEIDLQNEIYSQNSEQESYTEGKQKVIISTAIERNPKVRKEALKRFGYNCAVCGFNFEETYGEWGRYFVEIHHIQPLSESKGVTRDTDPKRDLSVLCANCHRMVHRKRATTLTIDELKAKLR
jgi:hypothetical protein